MLQKCVSFIQYIERKDSKPYNNIAELHSINTINNAFSTKAVNIDY